MLRQLIAARLAVELVLAPVRLRRLGQDLARDLLIAAICSASGVRGDLRPVDRDNPDPDQPALRQSERTDVNNSASAASWRTRNSAIVEWSGTRFAQITRTSSRHSRSIPREERLPL